MALSHARSRRILARMIAQQDGRCCYCTRRFTPDGLTKATLEHRKPKMDGGTDRVENLAAACLHCNRHRGGQMHRARQKAKARREVPRIAGNPEIYQTFVNLTDTAPRVGEAYT